MSDTSEFSLTYQVPYKRLRQIARVGSKHRFRSLWLLGRIWFVVLMLIFLSFVVWTEKVTAFLYTILETFQLPESFAPFIFIAFLFVLLMMSFMLRKAYGRRLQKEINFDQNINLTMDRDGVSIAAEEISYHLKWPAIKHVIPDREGIILAHGALFFFIPDSAFSDMTKRQAFFKYLFDHLTDAAKEQSGKAMSHVLQT